MATPRDVAELEEQIRASKANANNVTTLVEMIEAGETDPRTVVAAAMALQRCFGTFFADGALMYGKVEELVDPEAVGEAEVQFRVWLRGRHLLYIERLVALLAESDQPGVQAAALSSLMRAVMEETTFAAEVEQEAPRLSNLVFVKVVAAMVGNHDLAEKTVEVFEHEYLCNKDVQYYFMRNIRKLADAAGADADPAVVQNMFDMLHLVEMPVAEDGLAPMFASERGADDAPAEDEPRKKKAKVDKGKKKKKKAAPGLWTVLGHQRAFEAAWISFLRLPLTADIYKQVLARLHDSILPHMPTPVVLMDFLTDSYDQGGVVSLLALDGIFSLMQKHNLDYPDFYNKLYSLLTPQTFNVKYRVRFFRLLGVFMTSTHLPTYIAAAFAKRLARLMLLAPVAGCLLGIPTVYNILLQHKACRTLLHRPDGADRDAGLDPFLPAEPDLAKTRALDSSLWELAAMANHCHPMISHLAKAFQTEFRKTPFSIEDFATENYETLTTMEMRKRYKDEIAWAIKRPRTLLPNERDGSAFAVWADGA